jgi:parallel beta-helix repeat protein
MISDVSSSKNKYGIYLYQTSDNNIVNSALYDSEYGAYCYYTSDDFTDCKVFNNSNYGLYIRSSSNNHLIDCDIYNNNKYGIRFYYATYNNIETCNIYNNPSTGIELYQSSYNNITYCNFYENNKGVYMGMSYYNSRNNLLHHNNFANNPSCNASDACSNTWDNGSEGNYWGDYTGVDANGDGIGDTPYNISGKTPPNQDRYPLMEPVISAPELLSPPDGYNTEDQTPTFDWTDVPALYPVTYSLQVANDSGFTTIVINETGLMESEYTPTTMGYDTYYWKVKAMVGIYDIGWSDVWSFTVELDLVPPTTPNLIEPANNSTIVTPVIFFDWNDSYDIYGIDYYILQVATDDAFDDIVSEVTSDVSEYTLALATPDDYYWRLRAVDNNGLFSYWSEVRMFTRLVDTSPPVVELIFPIGGEYLSGTITITWNITDDLTPDDDLLIKIEYRCGGSWQTIVADEENDGSYEWNTTGYQDSTLYLIRVSTVDNWGHSNSDKSYTTFTVDNTNPVTTAYLNPSAPDGENDWYTSNMYVTLVATDATSGVDFTEYNINGGIWTDYIVPFTMSEDGMYTVEFRSVDNAGNEETANDVEFKIDTTAPMINLTVEKTGLSTWLLTATVSDETSGIAKVEFYLDSEYLGEVTTAPYTWDVSNKGTAQAIVYDNAGNSKVSNPIPVSVEFDKVSQSETNSQSQSSPSSQSQTISSFLQRLFNLR